MTGGKFGFDQTSMHFPVHHKFSYGQRESLLANGNRSSIPLVRRRGLSVELKSSLQKIIQEVSLHAGGDEPAFVGEIRGLEAAR